MLLGLVSPATTPDPSGPIGLPQRMQSEEQFETFVRAGLARYGLDVEEAEMHVIRFADQMYGPHLDALMAADLSDVEPETPLDPTHAPLPSADRAGT